MTESTMTQDNGSQGSGKTDWLHKLLKVLDHNRWTALGLVIAAVLAVGMVGCQPTTASLTTGESVDATTFEQQARAEAARLEAERDEINRRIEAFNAQVAAGTDDLEQQQRARRELLDLAGGVLTDLSVGQLNPAAYVIPGLSALALALGVTSALDNRRKDRVIQDLKIDSGYDGEEDDEEYDD